MEQPNEYDTRTDLFTWVRSQLPTIDLEQLKSRLQNIDLNAPISPNLAYELIDEAKFKSFMQSGQRVPGLIKPNGQIFRVSLFAALCSLPLPKPVFDCFIEHKAQVSKITGATSPLTLAIYGNQVAVADWLVQQNAQLQFDPSYDQNRVNLGVNKQVNDVQESLQSTLSDMQTQLEQLGKGLFGANFQAPPRPQRNQQAPVLELADSDLTACEPHLHLCSKLNRWALFETLIRHPQNRFNPQKHGLILIGFLCHTEWEHSALPYLRLVKECGVPIDTVTSEGHTPLHLAIIALRVENVRWLLENGANAFKKLKDEELLKLLRTDSKELSTTKIGDTSFFTSGQNKKLICDLIRAHKKAVLKLCELAQSEDSAALEAHLKTLPVGHYLLNAFYSNKNSSAVTPLSYAVSTGKIKNAELLQAHGANPLRMSKTLQTKLAEMQAEKVLLLSITHPN